MSPIVGGVKEDHLLWCIRVTNRCRNTPNCFFKSHLFFHAESIIKGLIDVIYRSRGIILSIALQVPIGVGRPKGGQMDYRAMTLKKSVVRPRVVPGTSSIDAKYSKYCAMPPSIFSQNLQFFSTPF